MIEPIIFILSGIFIGIAAGLFGLGGGLIIVPVVTYSLIFFSGMLLEEAILFGISTSLASMVLTGAMAFYAHNINKNIDYKIINKFIYGLILGAIIIGYSIKFIPGASLKNFFIIYTFFIAYKLFNHKSNLRRSPMPNQLVSNLIGFFFSIISGLVGIGGATLYVPYLIKKNVPSKLAIGTSSVLGFLIGLSASIAIFISSAFSDISNESLLGFIYIPAILFLTLPSLIFVKISAGWLLKIPETLINKLFCILLIVIGLLMLFLWFLELK